MKYCIVCMCLLLHMVGCSSKGTLSFCEGTDTQGAGVNCGTRATTGELVMLISARNQFQTEKLLVKVVDTGNNSGEVEFEKTISVDPAALSAQTDLVLYNEGEYRVTVYGQKNVPIAEGSLQIIE
jgi:hypothetical protein